jgi:hypothetical protein
MGGDQTVFARAGGQGPWPETIPDLEKAAVYILLRWDKPRAWGKIDAPTPTLHAKDISVGLGIDARERYEDRWYLEMKWERVLHPQGDPTRYLNNPLPRRRACYELTPAGEEWAQTLLAEAHDGRKPWLLEWA